MVDEAHARGITIDADGLSEHLGIPVIEAVAPEGRGIAELREALPSASSRALILGACRRKSYRMGEFDCCEVSPHERGLGRARPRSHQSRRA